MGDLCAWCGEPSVREVEVEPPVFGTKPQTVTDPLTGETRVKNAKAMTRRAIKAEVCDDHLAMVERNRAEKAARETAERERRKKLRERGVRPTRRRAA